MQHEDETVYTVKLLCMADAVSACACPPDLDIFLSGYEILLEFGRPEPSTASAGCGYRGMCKWDDHTSCQSPPTQQVGCTLDIHAQMQMLAASHFDIRHSCLGSAKKCMVLVSIGQSSS